jgi:putative nucleotidyltransferase with HDIG domain
MQKQIDVQDLKIGMYVSQADRPWLETPFLFQGFFIESQKHIEEVQSICEYVYIDIIKGNDSDKGLATNRVYNSPPNPKPSRVYINTASLEQEIAVAEELRKQTRECIDEVFENINNDEQLDMPKIKRVVRSFVDSIVRNPDAQMCLAQIKDKDEYTAQHCINVCVLSITFGRHLGMAENSLNLLGLGALLHDVGKLKTPLEILNKEGSLTADEFDIMKAHPLHGKKILEKTDSVPFSVIDIAMSHHERLAGHGYPNGKMNKQISPWSKLVAIVDVFDAITSDRCYHDAMSPTQALTKMYEWRLRDFDPELLEQFIQCIGIYPIGTIVELTSGEVGVVISVNTEMRLRPKVLLILDENKNPYYPTRIADLAVYNPDINEMIYGIENVLEPGTYNIDVKEHMKEIHHAQRVNMSKEIEKEKEDQYSGLI